jgi:hypothetical protein
MAHPFQRKQLATRVLAWVLVTLLFSIAVLAAIYRIWPRRWKRDQGGHPKSALLGSHRSFRLASRILRCTMILHRQRRISHNGLWAVLSGTRSLERLGAWLALGHRRKSRQVEQDFETELISGSRSVRCVARTSLDRAIQPHLRGSFLLLRMSCNKAWE